MNRKNYHKVVKQTFCVAVALVVCQCLKMSALALGLHLDNNRPMFMSRALDVVNTILFIHLLIFACDITHEAPGILATQKVMQNVNEVWLPHIYGIFFSIFFSILSTAVTYLMASKLQQANNLFPQLNNQQENQVTTKTEV